MPRRRLIVIPVILTLYSFFSLGQVLHRQDFFLLGLLLWVVCNALTSWLARPRFTLALTQDSRHLTVPGSWTPLVLYLMIFSLRFVYGMLGATHPALLQEAGPVVAMAALSGLLSGLVNARSLRLLQSPQTQ